MSATLITAPAAWPLAAAWRRLARQSAQTQFLLAAGLAGLILVLLIPPLAGGNERFNFQRTAMIASGRVSIGPTEVPRGIVRLLETTHAQFPQGRSPPYRYDFAQFDALAAIPLDADEPARLDPNPIAILNPVAYIPQVLAYRLGQAFGASPLWLFYLGRLAGLAAGLALTFVAIREMPQRARSLAMVALLPTIVFSRATLDADQVTNGLAFLFVAAVLRSASLPTPLTLGRVAFLAALAFFEAQCKTAYMVLLPLALAIPAARYGSRARWALASAAIILPGVIASALWMVSLKTGYFAGLRYDTAAGHVFPDAQTAAVLANPLGYLTVFARTVVDVHFLSMALVGLIGIFGPPVMMPSLFILGALAALILGLMGEGAMEKPAANAAFRALAVLAFLAGAGLVLTLLYVQWTGLGASTISGFSGRYLFPLLPALLVFLPAKPVRVGPFTDGDWGVVLGALSLVGVVTTTAQTYWL